MDDYNLSTLIEAKNEWCARLINILTPCIIDGINSVFNEAYKMCIENNGQTKYLMTFQNLLNNIPKWSSQIVEGEKERIESTSGCNYLEDLLTCVHITHLKSLTTTRAGIKHKKVNVEIPNLNSFIHKIYINSARKIYVNVYLFEKNIMPLQTQKNNRELEIIIKECILNTIRENIPIETILRTYLDETNETGVEVKEEEEIVINKELLEQQEKKQKEEELEKVKKEVKEKIKKEADNSIINAIKKTNKDINSYENEVTDKSLKEDTEVQSEIASLLKEELEIPSFNKSISDDKLKIFDDKNNNNNNDNDNFDINIDSIPELNIKTLDSDPDNLNLDILDLDKSNVVEDSFDDLKLDIKELV
tara:strand:+ start:2620 stop:3705 length:1086 start_codon:yes stop_codon:yes gene_type:complete